MPGFQVNPNELAAGRGHHDAIAGEIGGSAGLVRAAAAAIAEAAGHAGASAAGADWGAAWEAELAGRAEVLRRTGQNLAAAADAYRETDEGQMRR
jgi:uncharacterized protein YukE